MPLIGLLLQSGKAAPSAIERIISVDGEGDVRIVGLKGSETRVR